MAWGSIIKILKDETFESELTWFLNVYNNGDTGITI